MFSFLINIPGLVNRRCIFDVLLVPNDINSIRKFYFDRGFFEAIVDAEHLVDTLDNTVKLVFKITEGDPSFFRDISISGLNNIDGYVRENIIRNIISIDSTMRYGRNTVEETILNVSGQLKDHGYMLVSNDIPQVTIDTMLNKVDLALNFKTGYRYWINDVRVQKTGVGRNLVEEDLLKDIAGIKEDTYYSYFNARKAQVRLYRTNLFRSVLVNSVVADTSANRVPMMISADVGLLNEVSPELILNNENNALNFGFGIGFARKNFLGDARKLSLNTSAASEDIQDFISNFSISDTSIFGYTDARVAIQQPFLFGELINTRWESYVTLQKRKDEYNATIYGTKLTLDFELPRITYFNSFSLSFNWELSEYNYQDPYLIDGYSIFLANLNGYSLDSARVNATRIVKADSINYRTRSTNAILGFDLKAKKTDDFLFPTRGYSLSLNLDDGNAITWLVSKVTGTEFDSPMYVKLLFNTSAYLPVYSQKTSAFGLKFKIGNIFTYKGNEKDIPANQRFYAGGSNSNRGWKTRQLVPDLNLGNVSDADLNEVFRGLTPGGFFMVEGSVETRNRIIGKFGGAAFIDYGNTWGNISEFSFDKIAVGGGIGLRYYSDFAPIRIDFGFKLYDPDDRRSFFKKRLFSETLEFHLGIGEAF